MALKFVLSIYISFFFLIREGNVNSDTVFNQQSFAQVLSQSTELFQPASLLLILPNS